MSLWDARNLARLCTVGGRTAMVWYDDQNREWWMEDRDPSVARTRLLRTLSAINVTNAYEVLTVAFLEKLAREAHWLETEPRGLAQSAEREAARPVAPPENGPFKTQGLALHSVVVGSREAGISMRYVREYDIKVDQHPTRQRFTFAVVDDHDLHRLADDGGPADEGEL